MAQATILTTRPTVSKRFGIDDLSFPPQNYASFLSATVESIMGLLFEYRDRQEQSLDEVTANYKAELEMAKKASGEDIPDDWFDFTPLTISVEGTFSTFVGEETNDSKGYRRVAGLEESLFFLPMMVTPASHEAVLPNLVNRFSKKLDELFPDRGSHLQFKPYSHPLLNQEGVQAYLEHAELRLRIQSRPMEDSRIDIIFRDNGGTIPPDQAAYTMIMTPGIDINATTLNESMGVSGTIEDVLKQPTLIVARLAELASGHYTLHEIEDHNTIEVKS